MEYFRLEVFRTVCRCGSYTGAARELGITQPAVSQNISALEAELGTVLFIRPGRGSRIAPTPAASILLKYAEKALQACRDIGTLFNPGLSIYKKVYIHFDPVAAETVGSGVLASLGTLMPGTDFSTSGGDAPDVAVKTETSLSGGSCALSFDVSGTMDPVVSIVRILLSSL